MVTTRFAGRTVFVSGGAHGIGAATVRRFAAEGARVIIADVDERAAHGLASELGAIAIAVPCDVTCTQSVDSAVASAVQWAGHIDVLALVAGTAMPYASITEVTDDHWERELSLNLTGVMRCIRAVVPHLVDGGAIVSVSSVNGLAAFGNEPYSSAKGAQSTFARNLAIELADRGIRINVVAPGTVNTRVWKGIAPESNQNLPLIPLGRLGEPSDIAAAIAFLASDDASWITGVTLPVDGGMLAGPRQAMLVSLAAESAAATPEPKVP